MSVFTHVINNKEDGDSNSTAKYWNNTIDDLLYIFLGQLHKWQVMEQKKRKM